MARSLVRPVVRPLLTRVRRWAVESQQGARRNAMLASTALAARRAERDDVESFLHSLAVGAPAGVAVVAVAHG